MAQGVDQYEDAFGNQLSRVTFNNADLAAHYDYSPKRYRFYRNGSRVLLQYEDIPNYSYFSDRRAGDEDVFVLSPDPGDTLQLKTAERFRYTVNFVSEVTQALALSQELEGDDYLTYGLDTSPLGDLSDGYFLDRQASHSADEIDLLERRQGNDVFRKTVGIVAALDVFQRWVIDYNWYNVGEEKYTETLTENKTQKNVDIGTSTVDAGDGNAGYGGRGPISGNGRITVEINADANTTGLELYTGSMSFTTLGGASASVWANAGEKDGISTSTPDEWEPLFALRADPERPNVSLQVRNFETTAGEGKVMCVAVDPSKALDSGGNELTDSDFSPPEEYNEQNSVVQTTEAIAQIPDAAGAVSTSVATPGGYQLAFDTTRSTDASAGQGGGSTRGSDMQSKQGVLDGDIAVYIAKQDSTYSIAYPTEEDW